MPGELRIRLASIPRGTTIQFVTGLHTGPADLIHPASDICFLLPVSFTTGPVASRYPREDLHLLDDYN